jgi:hypothetical protein
MSKVEIKVIEALTVKGNVFVSCDLSNGELVTGQKFTTPSRKGTWKLVNFASVSPELYKKGRRGITLLPSPDADKLESGDFLFTD